ncbi:MAG TPA: FKBP-type peptidyl-prolyl cis-trans isomerase [bacterium]
MARPRYTAAKRQREIRKQLERQRKLARKHGKRTPGEQPVQPLTAVATVAPAEPEVLEDGSVRLPSGLQYLDLVEGDGPSPQAGDNIEVHYTGWLENGTKFDSSIDRGQPFVFPIAVGRVIKGWDEGVVTMRVGGKRRLAIPAHLAYGDRGAGGVIPPRATLIFEVELLAIRSR